MRELTPTDPGMIRSPVCDVPKWPTQRQGDRTFPEVTSPPPETKLPREKNKFQSGKEVKTFQEFGYNQIEN